MSPDPIPLPLGQQPGRRRRDLDQVLTKVGRGDEDAFGRLYDALSPAVYGLARRVVRDPARAEEIAQEVFLSVWQQATRFDPARGSASTWVLTLTHRRAVDVWVRGGVQST